MHSTRPHGAAFRPAHRPSPSVLARAAAVIALCATLPATLLAAGEESERVRLETTKGDIVLELDAGRAPETVENFLRYVDDGYYDGTIFHRVIEGFMIQGGGFSEDFAKRETRSPIRNEAGNGLSNRHYTIAMARTNAPHSATAQFFINAADNTNLDHSESTPRGWGYAVFGRVVDGQDVVDAISRVPTGAGGPFRSDAPREPVVIVEASRAGATGEDADESSASPSARPTADGRADDSP